MYRNILVNALVNLGDVILTTSALDLVKKNFPATKITMLVKSAVKDAVIDNPVVDDVIALNYTAKKSSFREMRDLIVEIRRRKFDLAISFDRKLRPALITFAAGIPRRVCPTKIFDDDKSHVTFFYTDVVPLNYDLTKTLQAENYQEIVRKFFKIAGHGEPHFPKKNSPVAEKLLGEMPKDKLKIGLCVKGSFPLKTYPKEYFAQVVNALRESYDAAFFVIGAPNEKDYAEEVISEIGGKVFNFCDTSLIDAAEIFRRTDLFITVDTGSAHIAATTGVKMVTMFGCTSPLRWAPINKNSIVLTSGESCCPCSHDKPEKCPSYPKPRCLYNVKPEEVIAAARKLLG